MRELQGFAYSFMCSRREYLPGRIESPLEAYLKKKTWHAIVQVEFRDLEID